MTGGRAVWAAVLLVLVVPVWGEERRTNHGRVFPSDVREISVRRGQVFSLHWKLAVQPGTEHRPVNPPPDPAVVAFTGTDRVRGDPSYLGDGGELYLVFRAVGPGTTELTLDNCRESCGRFDEEYRERRTYRIVVR
ncbi:hypothetical protein [Kitasatospora phosalacinea]|uniref:hypothetical protein n=1 Tax=Kitasatospora phosalacinea TaxID=2065 RepID=UPI002552CFFD|nr:hypothetical protein [Kitasatospora phosalacinea]